MVQSQNWCKRQTIMNQTVQGDETHLCQFHVTVQIHFLSVIHHSLTAPGCSYMCEREKNSNNFFKHVGTITLFVRSEVTG